MYQKVSTSLNFVEREKETLAFWKENKIFEKSVELRRGAEPIRSSTGRRRQTASRISATSSPAPSRTSSPATAP